MIKIKTLYITTIFLIITNTIFSQPADNLDIAYSLLKEGNYVSANKIFENYAESNPTDTRIYLQLGYNYKIIGEKDKSDYYFNYVIENSVKSDEVKNAQAELGMNNSVSPFGSFDLYSHNMFDSYQENYISNTIIRVGKDFGNKVTFGLYADSYFDTKSKPGYIYNDRYMEGGGFFRYKILKGLAFEFRAGYVREIDYDKNSFNFKPIITYGNRLGTYDIFSGSNPKYFAEVYSAGLYDHKFKNFFVQINVKEAMALPVGGNSALGFYLRQFASGDTKQFDYNNYAETAVGIDFSFKTIYLPTLFFETGYKFYFQGNPGNSFQIKTGLLFNLFQNL